MRRNSSILRQPKMRSGIAMIMAIGFLVIMAGLLATMMNLTSVTTKKTEHVYFTEQAQLLAKSATEFAVLAISAHNRAGNADCLTQITTAYPRLTPYFDIVTNIRYIGLIGAGGNCANYINTPFPVTGSAIAPESEGTVMIDVYVRSRNAFLSLNENISYHRRTLQKP